MSYAIISNTTFPSICPITTNLVWCLDAQNLNSYSGSGSTWTDLSTGAYNVTLNNCTFNNTTGNVDGVVFNGTSSNATSTIGSTAITNITLCAWAYVTLNTHGCIIRSGSNLYGFSVGIGNGNFDTSGNNVIGLYSGVRWIDTTKSYGTTGWHLVTMALDGSSVPTFYLDSTSLGSFTGTAPTAPATNWVLGACLGDNPSTRYFNGKIGAAYIFSTALSSANVTTIYQALARRSGLL